jgi:hypothetical protein
MKEQDFMSSFFTPFAPSGKGKDKGVADFTAWKKTKIIHDIEDEYEEEEMDTREKEDRREVAGGTGREKV